MRGHVGPGGAVAVSVSAGGQSANGSGHLSMVTAAAFGGARATADIAKARGWRSGGGYGAQAKEGPGRFNGRSITTRRGITCRQAALLRQLVVKLTARFDAAANVERP